MHTELESAFDQVFMSQQIFRLLLEAMARPGRIVALPKLEIDPPEGLSRPIAGLAFTLLDQETTFTVLPDRQSWSHYLCLNTGSCSVELSRAEFIIMDGSVDQPSLLEVSRGNLLFPDRGATLMIMVSAVGEDDGEDDGEIRLTLRGPGVPGKKGISLSGLCPGTLAYVKALNREFPLGVDLMICDNRGALVCIPRSSSITQEVNG